MSTRIKLCYHCALYVTLYTLSDEDDRGLGAVME